MLCIARLTYFNPFFLSDKLSVESIKSEVDLEEEVECEHEDIDIDVVSDKEDLDLSNQKSDVEVLLDRSGSKSPESTSGDPQGPPLKDHSNKSTKLEMKSRGNCQELESVECHLETKDLWEKFYELGTEMIITKTGR